MSAESHLVDDGDRMLRATCFSVSGMNEDFADTERRRGPLVPSDALATIRDLAANAPALKARFGYVTLLTTSAIPC